MPDPALPQPRQATSLPGKLSLQRVYRDALDKPFKGNVKITGENSHQSGNLVVPASTVTVSLVNGQFLVYLPPDTYRLVATLEPAEGGDRIVQSEVVTLAVTIIEVIEGVVE